LRRVNKLLAAVFNISTNEEATSIMHFKDTVFLSGPVNILTDKQNAVGAHGHLLKPCCRKERRGRAAGRDASIAEK
jgi:hypothetical protein